MKRFSLLLLRKSFLFSLFFPLVISQGLVAMDFFFTFGRPKQPARTEKGVTQNKEDIGALKGEMASLKQSMANQEAQNTKLQAGITEQNTKLQAKITEQNTSHQAKITEQNTSHQAEITGQNTSHQAEITGQNTSHQVEIKRLKEVHKEDIEIAGRDYKTAITEKDTIIMRKNRHIEEEKQKSFELQKKKAPSALDFFRTHKLLTAGLLGGVTVVGVGSFCAGLCLYHKSLTRKKERERALAGNDRFHYIHETVKDIYEDIDVGIESSRTLFVEACEKQKGGILRDLRFLQATFENSKDEELVNRNKKWVKNLDGKLQELHKRINKSILNDVEVALSCDGIKQILKSLEVYSQKRQEIEKKDAAQEKIDSGFESIIENIEGTQKYNSSLRLIISNLCRGQGRLFGGADKAEEFQVCKYNTNPMEWYFDIYKNYKNLRNTFYVKRKKLPAKKLDNKAIKGFKKRKNPSFFIEKDDLDKAFLRFELKKGGDNKELMKREGKEWGQSHGTIARLCSVANSCPIF